MERRILWERAMAHCRNGELVEMTGNVFACLIAEDLLQARPWTDDTPSKQDRDQKRQEMTSKDEVSLLSGFPTKLDQSRFIINLRLQSYHA